MELHTKNSHKDILNLIKLDPLESIEYLTKNAQKVQDQVLAEILQRNQNTEYLKRFSSLEKHEGNGYGAQNGENNCCDAENGGGMMTMSKDMFKRLVPVVTYNDVEPYIQRIANGDSSPILCKEQITEFLTSSGTSGGLRRLMPTIPEEVHRKKYLYSLLMPVMDQYIPGLDKGKGLYFLFIKAEHITPGGLLARPVLTSYYKSQQFSDDMANNDQYNNYTSPIETILCPDSHQSMYCQMLCGLLQRNQVLRMGAIFASGFLRAIKFLEENWPALCYDIQQGTLNPKITHQPSREAVMKLLKSPDHSLAESIRTECTKESWKGIIGKIWPNARYIEAVVTGTMSQYIPSLNFYGGDLPLVCTMYASSECFFGINLKPLTKPSDVSYTILPNMGYFEFIPLNDDFNSHSSKIVDLASVEVGKMYELVVTTFAGLYRYKVGDVLRVKGFHNSAPQFEFVCRKNVILSIDSDKTDEDSLHHAVTNAAKVLELETNNCAIVNEYTSYADTSTIPGHYVIFWEASSAKSIPIELLHNCCNCLEKSLDIVYKELRLCGNAIGPLEIRLVRDGSFDVLMDYFISQGSSFNQYKTPRCIKSNHALQLLNSRVILRAFSSKTPSWTFPKLTRVLN